MRRIALLFSILIIHFTTLAQTSEDRKDRIVASYLIAFGVLPADAETNYWMTDNASARTLNELMSEHKKNIRNNGYLADKAITNSYYDAFGRKPVEEEYNAWRGAKLTYAELMDKHMQFLASNPGVFADVIRLSYKNQFGRLPQQIELNNWKNAGARSYLSIVQQHQKNIRAGMFAKQKNKDTKLISDSKSGLQFEPSKTISTELTNYAKGNVISIGGGNVISTGGGNVISTGGGNVISTGGGNVISTGGGN